MRLIPKFTGKMPKAKKNKHWHGLFNDEEEDMKCVNKERLLNNLELKGPSARGRGEKLKETEVKEATTPTFAINDKWLVIALQLAEKVSPATNIVYELPKGLSDVKSDITMLKGEVAFALKKSGYMSIAERFEECTEQIQSLYPLIVVMAGFIDIAHPPLETSESVSNHPVIYVGQVHKSYPDKTKTYRVDGETFLEKRAAILRATNKAPEHLPIFAVKENGAHKYHVGEDLSLDFKDLAAAIHYASYN